MVDLDKLKERGCDVDLAIKRCADDRELYIELVEEVLEEERYLQLKNLLEEADWNRSFEYAHALKGVAANLSLTPVEEAVTQLVEALRPGEVIEYNEMLEKLIEARKRLVLR